jgi:endonuclease III
VTTGDEKQRTRKIISLLRKEYPDIECSLNFSNPFELTIATILAAQCTDERVNQVTANLFRKYRKPEDFLQVPLEELEADIRPTGFFRNKARAIQGTSRLLVEKFGGQVPQNFHDLLTLPGVARKTANVVMGNAFGIASGVVVDTHVSRITQLLGLTANSTPERIEQDLIALVPQNDWIDFPHLMIYHGRAVCIARRPQCDKCVLEKLCPSTLLKQ